MELELARAVVNDPNSYTKGQINAAVVCIFHDPNHTEDDWHAARAICDDDNDY